jgi:vitamin B12 transporter
MLIALLLAAPAVSTEASPEDSVPAVTVIASREPVPLALAGTAITVIDRATIEALALPLAKDYLTLSPSVAVAQTGPLGAQTQVRIRGAEANQTLTFIDGIDVTDPAGSGEFRYESLLAQGIDRIDVLRGGQSALWGAQAIGGVIAITTRSDEGLYGEAEGGSLGTVRGGAGGGTTLAGIRLSGQAAYLGSDGYNIAAGPGDKDGYENLTLHGKASADLAPNLTAGVVLRYVNSNIQFDDFDYGAGVPLDAPLSTRSRQFAVRGTLDLALLDGAWRHGLAFTHTDTANINRDGAAFTNRSDGGRDVFRYQSSGDITTGAAKHRLTFAVEHDRERFTSIDADPTALSNQSRSRLQTSLIGEYRLDLADWLGAGVAVRHDFNNRFADATTVRATAAVRPGAGFTVHASYGEGVTDPSFFELFGFFPGFFVGNPNVTPERSQGWDIGAGWADDRYALDVTWYRANLVNEIVSTFDSTTFLSGVANATGRSRRQGLEVTASAAPFAGFKLSATYAYLDASEQRVAAGLRVKEVRRPAHSGSITAAYTGRVFDLAASAAITGGRDDTDFALFVPVRLPAYTLVTLTGAWHVSRQIDITARLENALDANQVDVFAYRGPGLTAHAGVRLKL